MQINELHKHWQTESGTALPVERLSVSLSAHTAARLKALAELYPGLAHERLVADLLDAAVDEFERSLPYVPGSRVIEHDEQGDPIYEDAGLTPRFQELTRAHLGAASEGE